MRLLFVSGTATGGNAVSTRQLARRLAGKGHRVARLARHRRRNRSDLVAPPPGPARRLVSSISGGVWREVQRRTARRPRLCTTVDGAELWTSAVPEAVVPWLHTRFQPDVVVVSAIHRRGWTAIHAWATAARVPLVLNVQEEAAPGTSRSACSDPTR